MARKIMHPDKFYVRIDLGKAVTLPGNFKAYPGSVYGRFTKEGKSVFWVCDNYALIEGKLPIHICINDEWKLVYCAKDESCYQWVKSIIMQLGYVPTVKNANYMSFRTVENMMRHDRLHKKGSGQRICTNQLNPPLRWKEVTEVAHWFGKGNASVVASNIR